MYGMVVETSRCPSNSCTVRMSAPPSNRCVANECRGVWHVDRFVILLRRTADFMQMMAAALTGVPIREVLRYVARQGVR